MAPRKKIEEISFTVDSASENEMTYDELNALPTPESNIENKAPGRKGRTTATQSKKAVPATKAPAKGRATTRRTDIDTGSEANKGNAKKAPAKGGRTTAGGRKAAGSEAGEAEDSDDDIAGADEPVKPAKKARQTKGMNVQDKEEVEEEVAPVKRSRKAPAKAKTTAARSRAAKRAPEPEPEPEPEADTIPETQPESVLDDEMDVEESFEIQDTQESMPPPPRPVGRQTQSAKTRQPLNVSRGAASTSDSERDPGTRRKVVDLEKKLDAMIAKFESLKEAATTDKDSKFDQLKARAEQTNKDQDAVIKALKQQVLSLQARTSDMVSMKKEITQLTKENTRLAGENKKLTEALDSSHKENNALSTKLTAARAAPADTKVVPGSAMKARAGGIVLPGTAEAARDAQLQKQKVEMYCDLTNLVIVGVKKNEYEEEMYDCLQTGRNGTLHFHLTVAEGTETYEDTEFIYQPLLDEQRDRELLDLLPDYLTEEISFPRGQAAKFYCKVVDSMSKKIIMEEDEEE